MVDSFLDPMDVSPRVKTVREESVRKAVPRDEGRVLFKDVFATQLSTNSSNSAVRPAQIAASHPSPPRPASSLVTDSEKAMIEAAPAASPAEQPASSKEGTSVTIAASPAKPVNLAQLLGKEESEPAPKLQPQPEPKPVAQAQPQTPPVSQSPTAVPSAGEGIDRADLIPLTANPAPKPSPSKVTSRPVMEPQPSRPWNGGESSRSGLSYQVRRGDTLSQIVRVALEETGQPFTTSDLYSRVDAVARANGISNPNKIYVGQRLDLSSLLAGPLEPSAGGRPPSTQRNESPAATLFIPAEVTAAASLEDDLQVPVNGRISSAFGMREHPVLDGNRFHAGVDIAVEIGTVVKPMLSGLVVFAGERGGYGNLIEVDHGNGLRSRYGHLSEIHVRNGEYVTSNHSIGLTGETGLTTGPHLHFEIRQDGAPVDPLQMLSAAAIQFPVVEGGRT